MKMRTWLSAVAVSVVLALTATGCYSPYYSDGGAGRPTLRVFPANRDTVARNVAVFVEVRPSVSRITDFALYENYAGSRYEVGVTAQKRAYANDYLFCPEDVLSPYTRYDVWVEVDGVYEYWWNFDTSGGYYGNPRDCYYVEPRSAEMAGVKSLPGFESYAL